jgi:hypothetical protein
MSELWGCDSPSQQTVLGNKIPRWIDCGEHYKINRHPSLYITDNVRVFLTEYRYDKVGGVAFADRDPRYIDAVILYQQLGGT